MGPSYILSAVVAASSLSLLFLAATVETLTLPVATNVLVPFLTNRRRTYREEFLEGHNKYRGMVNLPPLTWDRNLTRYARRWGAKRAVDCKIVHSFGPYGENMFWGRLDHWTPSKVVDSWGEEGQHYHMNNNQCDAGEMCGHYTQIIWKETLRLGCARIRCLNGEFLVICEYDPPGNYVSEKPI